MKGLHMITWLLVIIGGINWGLSVFGWDIANWGIPATILNIVYILVGLSAIYEIFAHKSMCKACMMKGEGMKCEGKKCEGKKCEGKMDGMKM